MTAPTGETATTGLLAEVELSEPLDIKTRVVEGIAWKGVTQVVVQSTRVVVGVTLARLLSPRDFGLAAMALLLVAFVTVLTDLSLGAAVVQRRDLTERDRSTIFWTTSALGFAWMVAGVALSGVVASFFGRPEVAGLFAALSVTFMLSGLGSVQAALLVREMAFRSLQLREMGGALAGGSIGIGLALTGAGAWAIVAQAIAGAAASFVLVWRMSAWRPKLVYSRESLRDVGGYGLKLFASRLLSYFALNGDNLLIGRFLGAVALGTYSLAYNVMFTPMQRLATPIHDVVFPAFARLQDDRERLLSGWLRSKRISATILLPAYVGLLVTAPDVVSVVFGDKWHRAAPVLELLCVAGATQAVGALTWSLLQALGRPGTLLWLNGLETCVTVAAFALGLRWGIVGVAALFAISKWVIVIPDMWIACRAAGFRLAAALRAGFLPALPLSLAMGGASIGLRLLLAAANVPPAARLVIVLGVAGLLYLLLWRLAAPALLAEVRGLLPVDRVARATARRFARLVPGSRNAAPSHE